MADIHYFNYLLGKSRKKRYLDLEEHSYIKTFATTADPLYFNNFFIAGPQIYKKCPLFLYCYYVKRNSFYDLNMFYCFANLAKLDDFHVNFSLRVIVKHGNINIVIKFLEIFANLKTVNVNPYCHANPNVTTFIVNNYSKLVNYNKLCRHIISKGNIEMYSQFKHYIDKFMCSQHVINCKINDINMFKIVCSDFPNCLRAIDVFSIIKIKDDFVIEKLLENNLLSGYYFQTMCYNNYSNYRYVINQEMIQNKFSIESWYRCINIKDCLAIHTPFAYIINQTSTTKIIKDINNIYSEDSFLSLHEQSNMMVEFYNFVHRPDINPVKSLAIKEAISNVINKTYALHTLFYQINWLERVNEQQSICKNIFIEKTKNYSVPDWIELLYKISSIKTWNYYNYHNTNKIYKYYTNYASIDVKKIIVTIFKSFSFSELFEIIVHNKLKHDEIIYQIAETKIKELDSCSHVRCLNLCESFCDHFFK
jgi:hypothetical protein